MKLYLTQHGEALSKEQDANRPLSNKGIADIEHIASFLKQADIQFKRVIYSGKLRAGQTAQYLADKIALETSDIIKPNDVPDAFARQCADWQDDTLIVGHLPFLARLVSHLVNGDDGPLIVAFQPGSVVCLERIKDEQWVINWMIRPELLG